MDERCIDEEGDPCKHSDLCKGNDYGWKGCLMKKSEPVAEVPCSVGLCVAIIKGG